MVNLFPQLLIYNFFTPLLLRIAAACIFFYLATYHSKYRSKVAKEASFLPASTAPWIIGVGIVLEYLIALFLLIGLYTQGAAILGLIACLKVLFIKRDLRNIAPLSTTTYLLLGIICLSLIITGAGAVAFDIPL